MCVCGYVGVYSFSNLQTEYACCLIVVCCKVHFFSIILRPFSYVVCLIGWLARTYSRVVIFLQENTGNMHVLLNNSCQDKWYANSVIQSFPTNGIWLVINERQNTALRYRARTQNMNVTIVTICLSTKNNMQYIIIHVRWSLLNVRLQSTSLD